MNPLRSQNKMEIYTEGQGYVCPLSSSFSRDVVLPITGPLRQLDKLLGWCEIFFLETGPPLAGAFLFSHGEILGELPIFLEFIVFNSLIVSLRATKCFFRVSSFLPSQLCSQHTHVTAAVRQPCCPLKGNTIWWWEFMDPHTTHPTEDAGRKPSLTNTFKLNEPEERC